MCIRDRYNTYYLSRHPLIEALRASVTGIPRSVRVCALHNSSTPNISFIITASSAANPWSGEVSTAIPSSNTVSYTHLRAHETPEHLVCRLLLEKKKKIMNNNLTT
eukprot:TRINITY_DN57366_c0_g1_i3.p1 TRINITY_DN57366_c0_g1~~TRINITY_DN57366_c0_g1_i3.p1  ORF type:complete len:106 (+),score=16.74 TRINITY_DN57366_c0_g1_i3:201-518(+)